MSNTPTADLFIGSVARLTAVFREEASFLGELQHATPGSLPAEYRNLLAHTGHMTITLEAFHESLVDVKVLRSTADEASYAREILLTRRSDGVVVQYGLMRLWHTHLPDAVRREVESGDTPLGRVLIRHGLLRDVELLSLWRVTPSAVVGNHFGVATGEAVYGRSAQILVDGRPTVQLLEIVHVEK